MKIGALVFLTDQSGNPGAIAREAENLGFESFFVAEHMVVPSTYTRARATEKSRTLMPA
jgi:alkanesulfonate monooxygenase SsuD/methylene tetrahydromethanopterin reductase-like flavin-dependent oxidoreductase (luciferase family)